MDADIHGALMNINIAWRAFEHRGKPMTKKQVIAVLEYGLEKGYTAISQLLDEEVDEIIKIVAS